MSLPAREIATGARFAFGANWRRFLAVLNDDRIAEAERCLRDMLEVESLAGKSLLDIGSGSGLSSLAAMRLGARSVTSFDYDHDCVACTRELKGRYFSGAGNWQIERGDVLDSTYLASLGQFDVVYAWGVLHHTGKMWEALENVVPLVAPRGQLFIAIYNDQGLRSRIWKMVKRAYNWLPPGLRFLVVWPACLRLLGPATLRDALRGRPFATWKNYSRSRGMSPWTDVLDWVGGYPFEVAKPEAIVEFYRGRSFKLAKLKSCGGRLGNNQFVFIRCAA